MAPAQSVASYLRLSKKDDKSTSIDKQRANNRRAAAERFPGRPVVEYVDDGVSASKGKARAGLESMLAAVGRREHAAVIVDTVDRLTRERGSRALWDVAEACERVGADLVGASQEIDVATAGGELTVGVLASAARFEARRTAERVKATNRARADRGVRALGGPAVFGLVRDGDSFVPDQRPLSVAGVVTSRAELVRDAVARVIAGDLSIRGWAEELTRAGVPTSRGLAVWSHRATGKILKSPALGGMTVAHGDVLRGDDGLPLVAEDALLELGTWRQLQDALAGRAVQRVAPAVRHALPLLHGFVVDAEGHALNAHRAAGRAHRYECRTIGCPTKGSIDLAGLDALVVQAWREAGHADLPETVATATAPAVDAGRLSAIREEIARTVARFATVREAAEITALSDRLATLRRSEAEAEDGTGVSIATWRPTGRTLGEALSAAETDEQRREVLALHLDRVVVRPGRRGGPRASLADRVEIRWVEADGE